MRGEELNFECKNGRVSYIDLASFELEYKLAQDDIVAELKTRWSVERTTPPLGPFRMRYRVASITVSSGLM